MSIIIKDRIIDRNSFILIAGPCTIDSNVQLDQTAKALSKSGISFFRGGAYKMRTSPDSYQGIGEKGLHYLYDVCSKYNLISVSEVVSVQHLPQMTEYVDILLVGTRNMQNYPLLSEIGKLSIPVILKRGFANTVDEWLLAAEYIKRAGNSKVILCERGIRTFETATRNTLDLSAVPAVQSLSSYPVIVDPSHGTGRADMIKAMSWAATSAGADGLMIECDLHPAKMKCDAGQTISVTELQQIMEKLPTLTGLWHKTLVR